MFKYILQSILLICGWKPTMNKNEEEKLINSPKSGLLLLYPESSFWDNIFLYLYLAQLDINIRFITSKTNFFSKLFLGYNINNWRLISANYRGDDKKTIYLMSENLYDGYLELEQFCEQFIKVEHVGVIGINYHPKVKKCHLAVDDYNLKIDELIEYGFQQFFPFHLDRKIKTTNEMKKSQINYKKTIHSGFVPYPIDFVNVISLLSVITFLILFNLDLSVKNFLNFSILSVILFLNISEKDWSHIEYMIVPYLLKGIIWNRLNMNLIGLIEVTEWMCLVSFYILLITAEVRNMNTTLISCENMIVRSVILGLFTSLLLIF